MDGKAIRNKLIGSDDQRAVSPVIGVILMVAVTVILAALVAAAMTGMVGDMGETEAQGAAEFSVDGDAQTVTVEVTSLSNADSMKITGDVNSEMADLSVGETRTIATDDTKDAQFDGSSGTITAVAVKQTEDGDTVETTVGSQDFDFSGGGGGE